MSNRTPLSAADRASIEEALAVERADVAQQIAELSRDLGGIIDASALVATDDEHDPEGTTIAFERAQVSALLTRARERLKELDRALDRLRDGDYGRCEGCAQPIPAERLAIRPSATRCVACASRARR